MDDFEDTPVGKILGEYRLQSRLGRGACGVVYQAEHTHNHSLVAIKVLRVHLTSHEDYRDFINEARMIRLRHPHIISILDFAVSRSGVPYLVMEYAPGGTLRDLYPFDIRLPLATILSYTGQLASALYYAHEHKVIHRDVKPENVLLRDDGSLLLSDFGIAKILEHSSQASLPTVLGTPAYMAPEQSQGKPCAASDQYSLAVMVYQWIAGQCPFQGSALEMIAQHRLDPPPDLLALAPDLPPSVERVVLKALSKSPEGRFPSIREFALALEKAAAQASPLFDTCKHPAVVTDKSTAAPVPPKPPVTPSPVIVPPSTSSITRRALLATTGGAIAAGSIGAGILLWDHFYSPELHAAASPDAHSPANVLYVYRGHSSVVLALAWSPNGKQIVSCSYDETVQVWNAGDGDLVFTHSGQDNWANTVAWSPDGKWIVAGFAVGTVQVWNAGNGSLALTYRGHSDAVTTVAWSPDGKWIASGSNDETVQVWNAQDGRHLLTYRGHSDTVTTVAWSPAGGQIASGSNDTTAQVWNAQDGRHLLTYREHSDTVTTVAWSPDGKRIASGSNDTTAQVWNAGNGSLALIYRGHSDTVTTVAWSPDGKRIASGSADKTVQVWSASNGSGIFIYRRHSGEVTTAAWSPDGKRIASGSADKTVQIWRLP